MKFNWRDLPKPFFVLAPMENATDTVFRQIVISCARPDVMFTEFTNVKGLISSGNKVVSQRLKFEPKEQPMIAQIWGTDPDAYFKAAEIVASMGFSGIDINMGCPEKNIVKKGSCAGLIRNPKLAKEIISKTKLSAARIPISVKTRLGFTKIELDWIKFLLEQDLDALTVHLRTRKEMSKVPAHWELAADIVKLKNEVNPNTILIGNGDIKNVTEGEKICKDTGLDGIMIGRGIFHDPYAFSKDKSLHELTKEEKLELLNKHLNLFEKIWNEEKSFHPLKRYFKIYVNGFNGASDLREKLMETTNINEAKSVLII